MNRLLPVAAVLLLGSPSWAQEEPPLTRAEPVVRMVLMEAVGEPFAGQVAVAGVALDRAEDSRWPDSVREVVYQPWQFTGMRARFGVFTQEEVARARAAVEAARSGARPCGTVHHYHALHVSPSWSKRFREACRIGRHVFYGD